MTIEEIKAERAILRDKLQDCITPLLADFERRTGASPDVSIRRIDTRAIDQSGTRSYFQVDVDLSVNWKSVF